MNKNISNIISIAILLMLVYSIFFIKKEPKKYLPLIPLTYDLVIKNGLIYDGSGDKPFKGDVGIIDDKIAYVGESKNLKSNRTIYAFGNAVSPGFINMLSWAVDDIIVDGRSQGDIRQGVTLEVFGEGVSMGPLNDEMLENRSANGLGVGDAGYDLNWVTLGEYLQFLEDKGVSNNVASFVGATTLRIHQIGYDNRPPTETELDSMKMLVRQAMEEGAMGIGSSLIYAPAFYAATDELIELCKVASEYGGMYISHIRSEGNRFLESVDELITIASEAGIDAEIYHLKAGGKDNHYKLDLVIDKVDSARSAGLNITADMYTYTAGATGLDASMPPWVQEGGYDEWKRRLQDPEIRAQLMKEINTPTDEWENLYLQAGSASKMILVGFANPDLRYLTGKTLQEAADILKKDPVETMMDLVIEDGSRVGTVYFIMSEENIKKKIAIPWMRFGSDAGSMTPEGAFLESNTHPRAYGNFARLLGKYVRDEGIIPLEEAIKKLTLNPAKTLKIKNRGALKEGYYADVVIFNKNTIKDHSTFSKPHQFSTGVKHVIVNGMHVLKNGYHTGETPGRFIKGPGFKE
jgi:N-acyl-D-amino-acid deacylase